MNKGKIGTIFIISSLALAGIGATYAGLTDTLFIFGSVSTGTVDLEIKDYSGTWVWKVWGTDAPPGEIVITTDPDYNPASVYPLAESMLVSYAKGRTVEASDPLGSNEEPYDAVIEFDNLFPCIDFTADILFHYAGSIPAKVEYLNFDWTGDLIDTDGDGTAETDFIDYLEQLYIDTGGVYGATAGLYRCDENGQIFTNPTEMVDVGYQLHYCNYFKLIVTIHLPQDNMFQNLHGTGYLNMGVIQWNDQCGEQPEQTDIQITKTVDNNQPEIESQITFTITATNLGPDEACNIVVEDIIPDGLSYVGYLASQGSYDNTISQWNVGCLLPGESATLDITVTVDVLVESGRKTQLAMILDGSGSITDSSWTVMVEGLADAIRNCFPHDGLVELTVIQFSGSTTDYAKVEIGPIIVTDANYESIATQIEGIVQNKGLTPLYVGIDLAKTTLEASGNHPLQGGDFERQVYNLVTDGNPNLPEGEGESSAEASRDALVSTLNEDEGDEFDAEAVGDNIDWEWLRDQIVWPEPGYQAPPFTGPGWVRIVNNYEELSLSLCEKFSVIFELITNTARLYSVTPQDTNPLNDFDSVQIIPQNID